MQNISTLKKVKVDRSSNIELYRILVMLLIIAHHSVVNSNLLPIVSEDALSVNGAFFSLFGAWGKTGINCFVFITGYFMCKSNITLHKFLKLFLQILTYNILAFLVFFCSGYPMDNLATRIIGIIPLMSIKRDFVVCFIFFYLLIPFLNILVRNLNRKQHLLLVLLLLFMYTIHGSLPNVMDVTFNYVEWFCVVYIVASYMRFYPMSRDKDVRFWGYLTLISWGVSVVSILFFQYLRVKVHNPGLGYFWVSDSNSILAFFNGVTSFMWFKNIKMRNSQLVNTVAACSFGVLLIHTRGQLLREWLWNETIDCAGHYDVPFYWLYAISCVLAIYVVCTIIEYIRIKTIETPLIRISEKFCSWVVLKMKTK